MAKVIVYGRHGCTDCWAATDALRHALEAHGMEPETRSFDWHVEGVAEDGTRRPAADCKDDGTLDRFVFCREKLGGKPPLVELVHASGAIERLDIHGALARLAEMGKALDCG